MIVRIRYRRAIQSPINDAILGYEEYAEEISIDDGGVNLGERLVDLMVGFDILEIKLA
jgi:hypothetical protein